MSPLRIAVIGRQNSYLYLASMTAITASAAATEKRAMKRALSIRSKFFVMTICRGNGLYARGPTLNQKRASSVCRAVRFVLFLAPKSLIHCNFGPFRALQRRRWLRSELRGARQGEGRHGRQLPAER